MRLGNKIDIHEGDWVHCQHSGIWRVYRVLRGFQELRFGIDQPAKRGKRVLVCCKRFVTDNWKQAFTAEAYEVALINPLTDEEQVQLDRYLSEQPDGFKAFVAYNPPN